MILLDQESSSKDEVVAWGAFPLINTDFDVNEGKFKLPMLFGKVDYSIDKFKELEGKYKRNLDEWLCNLYIEIKAIKLTDCDTLNSDI